MFFIARFIILFVQAGNLSICKINYAQNKGNILILQKSYFKQYVIKNEICYDNFLKELGILSSKRMPIMKKLIRKRIEFRMLPVIWET